MALKTKSAFFYGLTVTTNNSALDFQVGTSQYLATLNVGNYTATTLCAEIVRAMQAADVFNTYSATYSRVYSGGSVQSLITISSSTTSFQFLFGSGPRSNVSCASLLGFPASDTASGTTFTGSSSFGTTLAPELVGYSYLDPATTRKVIGALNVSASGIKETIVFSYQQFFQVEFKYEPEAKTLIQWAPFLLFASQQFLMEFAADITNPQTTIDCTLEKTEYDGKGMGYQMKEMLPDFPFYYRTGLLTFRVRPTSANII
jgi:hypothetical protein